MRKKNYLNFAGIFLIALSLRFILLAVWHCTGQGAHLTGDSSSYLRVAESLSDGLGFSGGGLSSTRRGPGYPLFLALGIPLGFPLSVQIFQAVLDALTASLIFRIGALLWNRNTGVVAGLSYGINYLAIKQCVLIMPEVLFTFFVVLSFYFYYQSRLEEGSNFKKIILAAVCASMAVLTKEVLFFYFIAWGIGALVLEWHMGRRNVFYLSLFLVVYALILTPWIIRSSVVQGKFALLTDSTGLTLYLGNNPTVNPRLKGEDWTLKVNTAIPPDVAGDEVHRRSAVQYIKANPRQFIKNAFFKLGRFWYPFYSDSPRIIKGYCGLNFIYMILFGFIGVWQNRERWIELIPFWGMIAYLSFIHSVTIASIRYRFVLEPFLLILAASAVVQITLHSSVKKTKIVWSTQKECKV